MKRTMAGSILAATTTSLTIPGMAVANAATPTQWDKVAACESTSNWDINTGNGFYGGLQFTASTWASFGGHEFASRADLATKQQQITVAERVLASQGKGAWPVCGKGLSVTHEQSPITAGISTAPTPTVKANSATPAKSTGSHYTVVSGDTLFSISARVRVPLHTLIALNPQIKNPSLIFAGDRVNLPNSVSAQPTQQSPAPSKVTTTQTVQQNTFGQSLVKVARSYLGDPYVYGGESTSGLDCSGLVQLSARRVGISLPRTADAQMHVVHTISRAQLQPGDLAFAVGANGRAYHVAIYIGNGQVLEAPKPGSVVSIRPIYSALNHFGRL